MTTTPTPVPRVARILIGVDDSPESLYALDLAALIGAQQAAQLTIVHVRPHPTALGFSAAATLQYEIAESELDRLVNEQTAKRLAEYPGAWNVVIRAGRVGHELLAVADDIDADLVVIGHRSHGRLHDAMLGSVASGTVHHSKRSILIAVPPD